MYNKHLPEKKIAAIIRCFCEDLTADATAALIGVSRNTVNCYFNEIRQRIFQRTLQESNQELGEFARGKSHVNGIESFWSYAKHRLAKFNGCKSDKFVIHLKETEFRFNHRNENLYKIIKKIMNN